MSFFNLFGMWLRKVPPQLIISARISAVQAGIDNLGTNEFESIFLVRRDPSDVMTCVKALILAHKANLHVSFNDLQAQHFAGRDVVKRVQERIDAQGSANWEESESIHAFSGKSGRTVSTVYPVGIVEIEDHPWFLGCQFHPEFKSRPMSPHPLFASFIRAALDQALKQ